VFQLGVGVLIIGSFFCGLSSSRMMLIASRAVQGIGGSALIGTSGALIADVILLRLRDQYQRRSGPSSGSTR